MNKILTIPFVFLLLSFSVVGTTSDYDVELNNQDYYMSNVAGTIHGSSLLSANKNQVMFPASEAYLTIKINASSIPIDATIDSATMYYYIDSYTASKGLAKTYSIFMQSGGLFLVSGKTFTSTGWNSQGFGPTQLSKINRTTLTSFSMSVPNVPIYKYRSLDVRAKEYNVSGTYDTYDAYLRITYTEAGGGVCTNSYIGGDFIVNEEVNCTDEDVVIDGQFIGNQSLLRLTNTNFTTNLTKQNYITGVFKILGDSLSRIK